MPRATRLHNKGKSTSIQKLHRVEKNETDDNSNIEESLRQFQLELCWCIQQLERSLNEKKGNEKQLQEAWKVLTVLKSNNQPIIRKRQLMRTHFGDYRAKMAAEEKKLAKMTSKIKISDTPEKPKATYLRKSAFLSSGDSSFRFNFSLAPEALDNDKLKAEANNKANKTNNKDEPQANNKCNEEVDASNAKAFKFSFTESAFKFNFNVNNS